MRVIPDRWGRLLWNHGRNEEMRKGGLTVVSHNLRRMETRGWVLLSLRLYGIACIRPGMKPAFQGAHLLETPVQ